jgi:hypothetical protein
MEVDELALVAERLAELEPRQQELGRLAEGGNFRGRAPAGGILKIVGNLLRWGCSFGTQRTLGVGEARLATE